MNTPITKASVEYTIEEANALLNLIDVAVKTLGLKDGAAENGVFLAKKLNAAFTPPKELNVLQQLPPVGE